MKNLFKRAGLISILDKKIKSNEIKYYVIVNNKLFIQKSKRSKCTLDLDKIDVEKLITYLYKKIPDSSKINISDYLKPIEIITL
jgi:hypothetical protein